ncbi:MAG: hypothetical protein ABEI86_05455, partial [Halobacteriaceae archaeon]
MLSNGRISSLSTVGDEIEYFDVDNDSQYDIQETVIRSDKFGDDHVGPSDEILMSRIQPGRAKLDEFEGWKSGIIDSLEGYIDKGQNTGRFDPRDKIARVSLIEGINHSDVE